MSGPADPQTHNNEFHEVLREYLGKGRGNIPLKLSYILCLTQFSRRLSSAAQELKSPKASDLKHGAQYSQLGEGNGNPLQYSCLENPMDRGPWWTMFHGVTESQTQLK